MAFSSRTGELQYAFWSAAGEDAPDENDNDFGIITDADMAMGGGELEHHSGTGGADVPAYSLIDDWRPSLSLELVNNASMKTLLQAAVRSAFPSGGSLTELELLMGDPNKSVWYKDAWIDSFSGSIEEQGAAEIDLEFFSIDATVDEAPSATLVYPQITDPVCMWGYGAVVLQDDEGSDLGPYKIQRAEWDLSNNSYSVTDCDSGKTHARKPTGREMGRQELSFSAQVLIPLGESVIGLRDECPTTGHGAVINLASCPLAGGGYIVATLTFDELCASGPEEVGFVSDHGLVIYEYSFDGKYDHEVLAIT